MQILINAKVGRRVKLNQHERDALDKARAICAELSSVTVHETAEAFGTAADNIAIGLAIEVERPGPTGLSIRDYFAAAAIQGFIAGKVLATDSPDYEFAIAAYKQADAMLKVRETDA